VLKTIDLRYAAAAALDIVTFGSGRLALKNTDELTTRRVLSRGERGR
jgi:hypothetical protein